MWPTLWILGMIGGIIFIDKAFRPKPAPVRAKKREFYTPHLIEPDGTIVCKKDINTRA